MDTLLSPRRRQFLQALGAAALVAGCGENGMPGTRPLSAFQGRAMGTTWTAKLSGGLAAGIETRAREAVARALDGVVRLMSTYLPDSELSRFNEHSSRAPFAVSRETLEVFALARRASQDSNGAFDITVAPAVDAWGFGPVGARRIPPAAELAALAPRVGYRAITVDEAAGTLAKARDEVRADLSGIAKGYAVERAAKSLDALGIADYMVEAGGEVRTRGRNAQGAAWRIGIERPDAVPQRAHLIVPLTDLAMATSGDYRIYFEEGGRRYSHEIDPATRAPVQGALASVSVADADCGYADAMATALFVLGPDRGFELAAARSLAACFILRGPGASFVERQTPAFAALGAVRAA